MATIRQDLRRQGLQPHSSKERWLQERGGASEPRIEVGILHAERIEVELNGRYTSEENDRSYSGKLLVEVRDDEVLVNGESIGGARLMPLPEGRADRSTFRVLDVEIGIGFHWDRRETQEFEGGLRFAVEGGKVWLVNIVAVESYLRSVIASEMSATSDLEFLKAHAVTSRSWLMAQVYGKGKFLGQQQSEQTKGEEHERIAWRDREDHSLFDVCADDHCQRYQGVGRISNAVVDRAIAETRGQVLTYGGEVCDARFSKCCGGRTEVFETCWGDVDHPYLTSFYDAMVRPAGFAERLSSESEAVRWVSEQPEAFCNTKDVDVLKQVLNSYDQETQDFFRWRVELSAEEVTALLREKGGIDIGTVKNLVPLQRGASGRISRLRIVGERGSVVVGKELEIRRLLSRTHLYSSAFAVMRSPDGARFTLTGAGWGHGVGLCQIGAAVMARKGFGYRGILYHYFRKANLENWW